MRAAAPTDQHWSPGQKILNDTGDRVPEHTFHQPVPITARIVWADDGEGRKFEGYIDGGDLFLADINPGNTVEGVLVFDIASDAVPAWIELHGSPSSGGVIVLLG